MRQRAHSRGLLLGKRANGEHHYSLRIVDSLQVTAESFKKFGDTCLKKSLLAEAHLDKMHRKKKDL